MEMEINSKYRNINNNRKQGCHDEIFTKQLLWPKEFMITILFAISTENQSLNLFIDCFVSFMAEELHLKNNYTEVESVTITIPKCSKNEQLQLINRESSYCATWT